MELFTPWHFVIVAVLGVLLFYRGDKLPDVARSVGRSLRVFKTEIKGLTEDDKARDAAQNSADQTADPEGVTHPSSAGAASAAMSTAKAIEAPATGARVVAAPSAPIPVHAEVVRDAQPATTRPRPRPADSASRQ